MRIVFPVLESVSGLEVHFLAIKIDGGVVVVMEPPIGLHHCFHEADQDGAILFRSPAFDDDDGRLKIRNGVEQPTDARRQN